MLLGIDASRAITDSPTGTENYSRLLINSLLRLDSPFLFRLYTRRTPPDNVFLRSQNCEVRVLSFPRLWTHFRLSTEMLLHAPDVLFVPAHVLPLVRPRRSIVTIHDLGYLYFSKAHKDFDRSYLDVSTRWSAAKAERVIVDSEATRTDLIRSYGLKQEKIHVVYPSYDTTLFGPMRDKGKIEAVKQRYGLSDYLLAVGTLQPRKNYARLLDAFGRLRTNCQLVIVGKKGWQFDSVLQRVQEPGLTGRVKFLDYAPKDDLPMLYAGARLCVLPSLYEGFGIPILEAQACETPMVCSNTSSLPEVAGEGAEYFDPLDVDAIAYAIARVISNDSLSSDLIERGRANLKRFSWERAATQLAQIITSL